MQRADSDAAEAATLARRPLGRGLLLTGCPPRDLGVDVLVHREPPTPVVAASWTSTLEPIVNPRRPGGYPPKVARSTPQGCIFRALKVGRQDVPASDSRRLSNRVEQCSSRHVLK